MGFAADGAPLVFAEGARLPSPDFPRHVPVAVQKPVLVGLWSWGRSAEGVEGLPAKTWNRRNPPG
jgi:hypothetical protein